MSVTFIAIPNTYPKGLDETQRSIIIKGQLLPYNTSNALLQITQVSLTSNVVTFTCANSLTGGGGQTVFVAGLTGALAFLNGSYTTASATTTTFTASKTASNIAATAVLALATLAPNYATGGLAFGPFYSLLGASVSVIAGIGPKAVPTFLQVFSQGGSTTQTYQVNLNQTSGQPLILDFTNTAGAVAQASNGAAVPSDSIGFYAEFVKDGY